MTPRGFTLVEILLVVVILAILAAVVAPLVTTAPADAGDSTLMSDLRAIRVQLELYRVHHRDTYPATLDLLTQETDEEGLAGGRFGPYLREIPINPFTGTNTVQTVTKGAGVEAWFYSAATGEFFANDADHLDW